MTGVPFVLAAPLDARLEAVADVEGKLPRALEELGPLAGRDVALLDVEDGRLASRLRDVGVSPLFLPLSDPLHLDVGDASLDAVVALWSAFRGVDPAAQAEVDRVLRPGGRLLVVHDYGRDDVSALRPPDAPEYAAWSRREGPFLRDAGFRIRVVHCFWSFDTLDDARAFLAQAFGAPGRSLGERLHRPRLSWNVAVYHRDRRVPERPGEVAG